MCWYAGCHYNYRNWCRTTEHALLSSNTWENTGLVQSTWIAVKPWTVSVYVQNSALHTYVNTVSFFPIQGHHLPRWCMAYSAYHYIVLRLNFLGCHRARKLCLCCASVWCHTYEPSWRREWLGASCRDLRGAGCRSCCDSIQPLTVCGRLSCWEITSTTWVGVLPVIHLSSAWPVLHWNMQLIGNRIQGLYLDYDDAYEKQCVMWLS